MISLCAVTEYVSFVSALKNLMKQSPCRVDASSSLFAIPNFFHATSRNLVHDGNINPPLFTGFIKAPSSSLLAIPSFFDRLRVPLPQPSLLLTLESKHNKFQRIAGAGVLCYFSTRPRAKHNRNTAVVISPGAHREPPGAPEHMFVNDRLQRPTMGAASHRGLCSFASEII